jgi:branched-chain amino acid transport system permease protein
LIALGLNLIYGIMGIINVAHGALYMLGAVTAWYIASSTWGNFWWGLLLAPLGVGVLGMLTERLVLRPIVSQPVMTILATFGVMLALEQTVFLIFGPSTQLMPDPLGWRLHLGERVVISSYRLFVAACALVTVIALAWFLKHTPYGTWIRAVSQHRELALVQGIPVPVVHTLAFGLGSALAALAGVLHAPIVSVSYLMGLDILMLAFIVVIVGGTGSLLGTVVISVGASMLQNLLVLVVHPTMASMLTLGVLGALLVVRPQGLFGEPLSTTA